MINPITYIRSNSFHVLVAVAVIAVGTAVFFYGKYHDLAQDPERVAQEETQKLVAAVGKLIVLPEGEEPTVATVSDPDKVNDQPFFAKAKTGDKVLLYSQAKKVILYDPVSNKIVEVSSIDLGGPSLSPTPTQKN